MRFLAPTKKDISALFLFLFLSFPNKSIELKSVSQEEEKSLSVFCMKRFDIFSLPKLPLLTDTESSLGFLFSILLFWERIFFPSINQWLQNQVNQTSFC